MDVAEANCDGTWTEITVIVNDAFGCFLSRILKGTRKVCGVVSN
jgi:hypothetical protein